MKTKGLIFGIVVSFLAGWWGAGLLRRQNPANDPAPVRIAVDSSRNALPKDFAASGADAWLVELDTREIEQWILQVAKSPETSRRNDQFVALFSRLFELDGKAAADLWMKIEADCKPDLVAEAARWAARSPDEAVAWLEDSLDVVRRFRGGRLVVDLAEEMIEAITERNPEEGARMLMENPAFYDPGCLFAVGLDLSSAGDVKLTERVVKWAAKQGDNPRNGLQTLSGDYLDAAGWAITFLARTSPQAAIELYESLPSGDKRRETWVDGVRDGLGSSNKAEAMTWWIERRPKGDEWSEWDLMPLMDWARNEPDEWLPWMESNLSNEVADEAMAMAIDRTSPPSLMHLRLCAAIRSEELRAKMIAQIRKKGNLEELREEAKGNSDLEALLEDRDDR